MTTCRGCGAFFTEGHDEVRCELVAQILVERRDWNEREAEYIHKLESMRKALDAANAVLKIDHPFKLTIVKLREEKAKLETQVWQLSTLCFAYEGKTAFPELTPAIFQPLLKARAMLEDVKAKAFEAGARQFCPDVAENSALIKQLAKEYGCTS
jgi:hypothetical protein